MRLSLSIVREKFKQYSGDEWLTSNCPNVIEKTICIKQIKKIIQKQMNYWYVTMITRRIICFQEIQ